MKLTPTQIKELRDALSVLHVRLERGKFESADHYQNVKDAYWSIWAQLKGTHIIEVNPAFYWHGGQSN